MQRIKKGDTVEIMRGKDRGKTGKVIAVAPKGGTVTVEGLNLAKKHVRPRREGEKGQVVNVARPLPGAAVMPFCTSCGRGVRVGVRIDGGASGRVRYCRKCQRPL